MKKSILAIGAAAVVGGLGFAGSAHAVAYFGVSGPNTAGVAAANALELNPGNVGHYLFVPYFSTQGTIGSMINITNTDMTNGKAVKVRFRGAANSDDVLDFTVFLSPGDVWSASLTQGADGRGTLSTGMNGSADRDTSCTLPAGPYNNVPFNTQRLASYLSADAAKAHTREGYVEVLNMADIPPTLLNGAGVTTTSVNPLYTNIKHTKDTSGVWKAPCASAAFTSVLNTLQTQVAAEGAGLAAPTGQLMGAWAVMNQAELAVYGSAMTAVRAVVTAAGVAPVNGYGNIAFAPQLAAPTGLNDAGIAVRTADPLLRGTAPKITALWFDLPDMSSPLVAAYSDNAVKQAAALSTALAKPGVMNDYAASAAPVPMDTDWVVSQPTRRYHAAVAYGSSAATAQIVYNPIVSTSAAVAPPVIVAPATTDNAYGVLQLSTPVAAMGPYACLNAGVAGADREERATAAGADFSPGTVGLYCGEVFTLSFGSATSKVLQSQVANTPAPTMPGETGWARLSLGTTGAGTSLPIVGFGATSIVNRSTNGNYGLTMPHRW